jgi:molybdate transport system substrate-binding protein
VIVFAAASLQEPFSRVAAEFGAREGGAGVELHTAGTPQLVMQVRAGALCDVFASADDVNMRRAIEAVPGSSTPRVFAKNRLAIVTESGNPHGVRALADLARDDLRVALCGPDVPAGRYAREALRKAGVEVRTVSDEPSVRAVVAKVRLGEVDAGIVYATDVAAAGGDVEAVGLPVEHEVVATYPIAVLAPRERREAAQRFVDFVLSPDGQRVLRSSGFEAP